MFNTKIKTLLTKKSTEIITLEILDALAIYRDLFATIGLNNSNQTM